MKQQWSWQDNDCDQPLGLVSIWPGEIPDYTKWEVEICDDSIEEWLYHYFDEPADFDRTYLENEKTKKNEAGANRDSHAPDYHSDVRHRDSLEVAS